jgi:hypothetical protein
MMTDVLRGWLATLLLRSTRGNLNSYSMPFLTISIIADARLCRRLSLQRRKGTQAGGRGLANLPGGTFDKFGEAINNKGVIAFPAELDHPLLGGIFVAGTGVRLAADDACV